MTLQINPGPEDLAWARRCMDSEGGLEMSKCSGCGAEMGARYGKSFLIPGGISRHEPGVYKVCWSCVLEAHGVKANKMVEIEPLAIEASDIGPHPGYGPSVRPTLPIDSIIELGSAAIRRHCPLCCGDGIMLVDGKKEDCRTCGSQIKAFVEAVRP